MKILVHAKPSSKRESIEKISENEFKIEVKEPPDKDKANSRIIKILSKEFKVSASRIKIKNPSSRKKIVEISE